jgi:hypothetical protein
MWRRGWLSPLRILRVARPPSHCSPKGGRVRPPPIGVFGMARAIPKITLGVAKPPLRPSNEEVVQPPLKNTS